MKIQDDRKLKELQKEFSVAFPYLKIEFYSQPHQAGKGSSDMDRLDPELRVGSIRENGKTGNLVLDENLSTSSFEQLMQEEFGLNIQVFRRSYGRWLQTWATDVWSLGEQNRRGAIMGEKGITIV